VTQPEVRCINVLLVEDDPGDVLMTREAFEDYLHNRLDVVTDGAAGMAYLRKEPPYTDVPRPDLILLDLNLPKKDGREVLAEIKEDPELRFVPVVVLTTSAAERDLVKSYNLHANAYIVKPIDLGQFIDVVQAIENFWFSIVKLPPTPDD
jgi:CheY-like chemotaxis protein